MQASPAEGAFVPDMPRRQAMNSLLVGAVGVSTLGLAVPYLAFFVPAGKFIQSINISSYPFNF